jgi:drug/metabolite transporter (DMT)-like permease
MDISLFLISLCAACLISTANLFAKQNVTNSPLPASMLYRSLGMLPFTLLFSYLSGGDSQINISILSYIGLTSAISFIGVCFFFKALQITKTPGLIAGLSSCNGLTVLLFGVFFGFPISLNSIPGVLLITLGLILSSVDFGNLKDSSLFKISSGFPYMILVMVFLGISFNMFAIAGSQTDPLIIFLVINLVELILSLGLVLITGTKLIVPSKNALNSILLYGFFMVLGFSSQLYAMSHTNPGLVSSVVSSSAIFSVLLAKLFTDEKLSIQKYFGISFVFFGLVTINLIK